MIPMIPTTPTPTATVATLFSQTSATSHVARQLWGLDFATPTTTLSFSHCTPFTLPSNGIIFIDGSAITVGSDVTFQPECTGAYSGDIFSVANLRDPFYASTIPQTYVIAASTVIAWILVIMLVITSRTACLGASSGSYGRGIIGGASGGLSTLTGAGSRPWLQKLATLTAAISLTIATADTFQAANRQYQIGFMDAQALRDGVLGSVEIRVVRVISDIFLWLAQVQTLIRLFPRHKEKVLIKWIGFALIVLDTIFSCLNSFLTHDSYRYPRFDDAIPALSYLFELALGLLYSAWVMYYAMTKRRYAFYHPKMRNICIIAVLSIVAISTPVVFFVTDISNPDVAGWGDYVRWVGAAAASVVVWEWVERIEALEQDEKKDGILGREVFDGDEMLDVAPTEEAVWSHSPNMASRFRRRWGDVDHSGGGGAREKGILEQGRAKNVSARFRPRNTSIQQHYPMGRTHSTMTPTTTDLGHSVGTGDSNVNTRSLPATTGDRHAITTGLTPPPPNTQTPISRADTTSAASTVYVVRYHPVVDVPQPIRRSVDANGNTKQSHANATTQPRDFEKNGFDEETVRTQTHDQSWLSVPNPFKRKRASPPKEVQQARAAAEAEDRASPAKHNFSKWDLKNRIGVLAAETGERVRDRAAGRRPDVDLPITIIPAQPRGSGRMWSPANPDQANAVTSTTTTTTNPVRGPTSSDGSVTLVNSLPSSNSLPPFRLDRIEPLVPTVINPTAGFSQSPAPRADELAPAWANGHAGTIVIPAPERRSPLDRGLSPNWSQRHGSTDS